MTPVNHTSIRNSPRPIAPKIQGSASTKRNFFMEPYKKKDERRRATHNEIEKRRRTKINNWIFKLRDLIPEEARTNLQKDLQIKSSVSDSKCHILIRACEYIKQIQQDVKSLRECLALNDTLRLNNEHLQLEVQRLKSNNYQPHNHAEK